MSMQDPIADMLTRLRNAGSASLKQLSMPSSLMKTAIAAILKQEGYITDYSVEGEGAKKTLNVAVKYYRNKPVISGIKRVSSPSCPDLLRRPGSSAGPQRPRNRSHVHSVGHHLRQGREGEERRRRSPLLRLVILRKRIERNVTNW